MPLVINGGRIPTRWAERKNSHSRASADRHAIAPDCVEIALINNMPDAALEDTEVQFFELLDATASEIPVHLKLYSLTGVPRGERAQQHLSAFYSGIDDLLNNRFDGVIMTGTEPRQPDLRNEPYWPTLVNVLDWAQHNTASTVLSCLAAHAGVLYSDGIDRQPLHDKQFGVFEFTKVHDHPLTTGIADRVRFPHSRWNEVRADALTACGYVVLTQSREAGVDWFVKKKNESLFVHFQGHPEYTAQTLLKEYRRDIRRFLRQERETYPSAPKGYFGTDATELLAEFRKTALSDPREELMARFPEAALAGALQNSWQSSALGVYRNWLHYVVSKKVASTAFPAMTAFSGHGHRKRSALP